MAPDYLVLLNNFILEVSVLQRRNDKIVPRLGISFDAKTLVTYNCNVMNPFHEKKGCCKKKKELIHIGIAPLSIKVSESRKSKSGLEKKNLAVVLVNNCFLKLEGKAFFSKAQIAP